MTFHVRVFKDDLWAQAAAELTFESLPPEGAMVLTGGSAAELVYPHLARRKSPWRGIKLYFSDERSVGPEDPNSNFGLVRRTLLSDIRPASVHRMHGEQVPEAAASAYQLVIAPVVERGIDLMLLGVGADAHIAGLFPGSRALGESTKLCVAVQRPDGMMGLTLTPPVLMRALRILLLVSGSAKAEAVRLALEGADPPRVCPVRLLADHPDATFVLDESAAARL